MNPRRLYRSRDRQLAGVAGGMAEYLEIDPTVVRILWILAAIFTGGLVILAYIVLALVVPQAPFLGQAPYATPAGSPGYGWSAAYPPAAPAPAAAPGWSPDWSAQATAEAEARQRSRGRGLGAAAIVGVVLVVIGAIALADTMLPGWSSAVIIGPAVIIALGAGLLASSLRRREEPAPAPVAPAAPTAPAAPAPGAEPAATTPWEVTDTQAVDSTPSA